jgi:hypothetical protein
MPRSTPEDDVNRVGAGTDIFTLSSALKDFRDTTMKKLILAAGFFLAATPAFAAEYYIVQNPQTKACTVMAGRPAPGGGLVLGARHIDRAEAENRKKTIRLCNQSTTGNAGAAADR